MEETHRRHAGHEPKSTTYDRHPTDTGIPLPGVGPFA